VRPGAAIINGNPYPLQTTPSLLFLDSSHNQKSTSSTICVRSLCNSIAGYYRELHIHPIPPCLLPALASIQNLAVHKLLGPPSRTRTWNTGIFCVFYGLLVLLSSSANWAFSVLPSQKNENMPAACFLVPGPYPAESPLGQC